MNQNEPTAAPDTREDFLRLYSRHELALRAFVRACLPRAADVEEVLQEASLVAWKKFATLEDSTRFARWVCLIARYEMLKFRRAKARDRLVLDEDIVERLAEEGMEEVPLRKRQLEELEHCLEKLPRDRRDLAIAAYAPKTSIRGLAARLGRSEGSLYQLLARIRQELLRCVQRAMARDGGQP